MWPSWILQEEIHTHTTHAPQPKPEAPLATVQHTYTAHPQKYTYHMPAHLHLSGFSETRALIEYGAHANLNCSMGQCVHCDALDDDDCRVDPRWSSERNTSFLAYCREERQQAKHIYEVPCMPAASVWPSSASGAGAGVTLSYAWKSFVDSPLDNVIEAFLLDRARQPERGPTMAVFSAGAHHFAMHIGHTNQIQSHNKDSWTPPQAWMDVWVHATIRLMVRLTRLQRAGVCCVWKTNNIGHRLSEGTWHHPSAEGGTHDYMNKISIAIAHEYDIPTIDLTPFTVSMSNQGAVRQKEGALPGMADFDYYHSYNHTALWNVVREQTLKVCTTGSTRHPGKLSATSSSIPETGR